jgi:HEAT repeat protein
MLNVRQVQRQIRSLHAHDERTLQEALASLKQIEAKLWEEAPAEVLRPFVEALRSLLEEGTSGARTKSLPRFRQDVAILLGRLGSTAAPALPELTPLLARGVPDPVREAAATALGNIGRGARSAVPDLLDMLTPDCRVPLAASVVRALGEIGCADQRVRSTLLSLWGLPIRWENSRFQVAIALCKLRVDAPGLIENLTATLVGPAKLPARLAAAEALSWCGKETPGVVPALLVALHDEDEQTRAIATAALKRLRVSPAQATQICCEQLDQCSVASTALRKTGADSVESLIDALRMRSPEAREKAAQTLGAIGETAAPAAPALQAALKDSQPPVRLAAAKALWSVTKQPDLVVPVLVQFLRGKGLPAENGELRRTFLQTVIEALGRIGSVAKTAIPALMTTIKKDDNRLIRESADRALRAIEC